MSAKRLPKLRSTDSRSKPETSNSTSVTESLLGKVANIFGSVPKFSVSNVATLDIAPRSLVIELEGATNLPKSNELSLPVLPSEETKHMLAKIDAILDISPDNSDAEEEGQTYFFVC